MDVDALTAARRAEWDRLDELSRLSRPNGPETDELVLRYRSASADLADIKTSAGRTPRGDYLSTLLARARHRLTGVRENGLRQLSRFFVLQLPAALYRTRWVTLVVALVAVLISTLTALWIAANPEVLAALGPESRLRQYANQSFTDYYRVTAEFAGQVWTNNAWLAAQCVLFGITGFWPAMVVMQNAVGVGQAAGILFAYGKGDVFFLSILPHGMLELTSVFVAAAAGMQIFWAWIVPGPRRRMQSVAEAGRSLGTVAIGLVFALALSGIVEGFVTGQPWHPAIKLAIGALALAVFLVYMLVLGRWAHRQGETGDVTEYEAGTPELVAG